MDLDVIIVNWKSGELSECLRDLEAQTVQPERVLVVDNASLVDSATWAEAFANLSVLRMDVNLGVRNKRALA
jgi:GT2 family glycosyltransferase